MSARRWKCPRCRKVIEAPPSNDHVLCACRPYGVTCVEMDRTRDSYTVWFDRTWSVAAWPETERFITALLQGHHFQMLTVEANHPHYREVYSRCGDPEQLFEVTYESRGPGHFDLVRLTKLHPAPHVQPVGITSLLSKELQRMNAIRECRARMLSARNAWGAARALGHNISAFDAISQHLPEGAIDGMFDLLENAVTRSLSGVLPEGCSGPRALEYAEEHDLLTAAHWDDAIQAVGSNVHDDDTRKRENQR